MILVEQCVNWKRIDSIRGNHCYNCGMRDGYPFRGQPDKRCINFILERNNDRIDKIVEEQLAQQPEKVNGK